MFLVTLRSFGEENFKVWFFDGVGRINSEILDVIKFAEKVMKLGYIR